MASRGTRFSLRDDLLVWKPEKVGRLELPLAVFNDVAGDRVPAAISGAASGNDEEPARIRLKPFGKRQGLVEIELRDDAGHIRGRAKGGIILRRD